MTLRCILSTADRIAAGLCLGDIPAKRARKRAVTCSDECQQGISAEFGVRRPLRRNAVSVVGPSADRRN